MEMMSKRSMAGAKKILFMQNCVATKQQGRKRERERSAIWFYWYNIILIACLPNPWALCVQKKEDKLCGLIISDVRDRTYQCRIHFRRPWALLSLFILSAYIGREIISCISSSTTSSVMLSSMLRMTCPREVVSITTLHLTCMFLPLNEFCVETLPSCMYQCHLGLLCLFWFAYKPSTVPPNPNCIQ